MLARREIEAALRRAADRMIAEVLALLPAQPAAPRRGHEADSAGQRIRRPAESLERLADEVLGVLARGGGLAVSEIALAIGASPRELSRPITWLLARGEITKTGERRGTRYFPARRPSAARPPPPSRLAPARASSTRADSARRERQLDRPAPKPARTRGAAGSRRAAAPAPAPAPHRKKKRRKRRR